MNAPYLPPLSMSGRVAGRVIVVTGAARGQGAAEVAALHAEGADIPVDGGFSSSASGKVLLDAVRP
jgi:NAD(P)-dependent dehydrogenase (short-subunit alcohol dehydrogenase family)